MLYRDPFGYNGSDNPMEQATKKKILYIITKSNFGGAQRYVYDLATHLPKDKYEVTVALGGKGTLRTKLEEAGIAVISIPRLARDIDLCAEVAVFFELLSILRRNRYDIVHLNSSKIGGLGALAVFVLNSYSKLTAKSHKLKAVFTAHGWAFKEKRRLPVKKVLEYASWLTMLFCDMTIVVSKDDWEKVRHFLFVERKIRLVHNGIDQPAFKNRTEARNIIAERIARHIADDRVWVGSIAELHKNKGLEYAIDGIAKIKSERTNELRGKMLAYIVIGGGEEETNLRSVVAREGLEDSVFFTGEIPAAAELLKAFDIFMLPSLKEGLPYVLLEAGWAGLPTVATAVGGVPEVIDDMRSGVIIKAKRPKEISDALTFLATHENKGKEFGERLKENVEKKFSLNAMLSATMEAY